MEEPIKVEAAPEAPRGKISLSGSKKQVENRNLLSSFFVTLLIGLAFQEMISPVRESIRSAGVTFGTLGLMSIFFLTSIRFFVGNQLHLTSEALTILPGLVWLYDLIVIITQSILLVFLAGNTTVERNPATGFGLVELLGALYLVDVLWIASQWAAGKVVPKWKRNFIPWGWAVLNLALVILMLILGLVVKEIYSDTGIACLLGLNFVAFLVDVLLMDYYDAI